MSQQKIRAGVSSACFFPKETIEAVRILAGWKIPEIEIFFNSPRELKAEYVRQLKEICEQAGTKVVSVHPFTSSSEPMYFFTDYPGRFEDGVEIYRHFFGAARELGARYVVFHGDSPFSRIEEKKAFAQLKKTDEIAREEYGVRLIYENVVRCRGKDPDYFARLKEFYPQMQFVLDVKQAIRAQRDPVEYLKKLGDSIVHIHISDSSEQSDCLPVGKGTMNLQDFLQQLQKTGFQGCILQELYRESYQTEQEVLEGYRFLSSLLEKDGQ